MRNPFRRRGKGARQIVISTRVGNVSVSTSNPHDEFGQVLGAALGLYDHALKGKKLTPLEERDHR